MEFYQFYEIIFKHKPGGMDPYFVHATSSPNGTAKYMLLLLLVHLFTYLQLLWCFIFGKRYTYSHNPMRHCIYFHCHIKCYLCTINFPNVQTSLYPKQIKYIHRHRFKLTTLQLAMVTVVPTWLRYPCILSWKSQARKYRM